MFDKNIGLSVEEWINIFDSLTDAVTIHDKDFTIIYANVSAKNLLNLSTSFGTLPLKCFRCYHGTEKPPANCPSCDCLITGIPTITELFEPHLNRFLEIRAIPRFDSQHQCIGVIHVVRDITEKKQIEKELKTSLNRFRTLFGESPVAIREEDFSGLKARFDELRKAGVSDFRIYFDQHPEEVKNLTGLIKILEINEQCLELIGGLSAEQVLEGSPVNFAELTTYVIKEEFIALAMGKTKYESEIMIVNKQGEHKYFDLILNVLPGSYESLSRVLITFLDITERKNAEDSLKQLNEKLELKVKQRTTDLLQSNKALEAFSHTVSHDLRAPLRAINGFSKILESEFKGKLGSEGERLIKLIVDSTNRMDQLIHGMLRISKISSGEIIKKQIDVDYMVGAIIQELTKPEDRGKISILKDPLPYCFGDPALIRQVWTNLIENAIKYSSKKEKQIIHIASKVEDGSVEYSIKDNGAGFNPEYGDKLFTLFSRLHTAQEFSGTGIGLAIVGLIIQRHGGRVWAEGAPEIGATFHFSLPDTKEP